MEHDTLENIVNYVGQNFYANLIATIGLIITLLITIYDNWKSRKVQKKALQENWYFSIIVQPNLNNIEEFYSSTVKCLNEGMTKLKGKGKVTPIDKARLNKTYKSIKNRFSFNFVTLVQSYDVELASCVNNQINDLQDFVSKSIDNYKNGNDEEINKVIMDYKTKLIGLLYHGVAE